MGILFGIFGATAIAWWLSVGYCTKLEFQYDGLHFLLPNWFHAIGVIAHCGAVYTWLQVYS